MFFEWDENIARANIAKHGIGFEEAKTVFNDPHGITFQDDAHSRHEERFISIGMSSRDRILLVVHTAHETNKRVTIVRIISCRRATAAERSAYEEKEG